MSRSPKLTVCGLVLGRACATNRGSARGYTLYVLWGSDMEKSQTGPRALEPQMYVPCTIYSAVESEGSCCAHSDSLLSRTTKQHKHQPTTKHFFPPSSFRLSRPPAPALPEPPFASAVAILLLLLPSPSQSIIASNSTGSSSLSAFQVASLCWLHLRHGHDICLLSTPCVALWRGTKVQSAPILTSRTNIDYILFYSTFLVFPAFLAVG